MSTRSFRSSRIYKFGEFELHVRSGELRKLGERVRLQEQPYRLLLMLLEHPGEVVLREEIRKRLWPNDTVVEISHGINAAVLRLREALGESAENPRFIETMARRGYRFRDQVVIAGTAPAPSSPVPNPPGEARQTDTETLSGKTLGHFRILERLGVGGMGVVYRAEDLKLGRYVAVKFLPPEMAGDVVSLQRFQREARTASALNHHNVCTVHSVEDLGGQPAIVMELLDGETLEARLARAPMEIAEALAIAIQIAGALDAAHRKGIVHRDLKPGNVVSTPGGVKVLDFGLATMAPAGSVTREGSIVGTPRYMSPEQLLGMAATPSSDIYSFGVVLREMLGPRAGVPALDRILERCLALDASERWHSAGDLKAALELVQTGHAPRRRLPIPMPGRRAVLASAGAAAACLFVLFVGLPVRPPAPQRIEIVSPQGQPIGRMSLAPDGEKVAFTTGAGRLYVRELGSTEARYLEGTENAGSPFWSADSKWVGYVARGELKKVAVRGGPPVTLARVNTNLGGAWRPQGDILIGQVGEGLFRVSSDGGDLTRVTAPDRTRKEVRHMAPQFLPGGRQYLYVAATERGEHTLWAGSLNGAEPVRIGAAETNVAYADGNLLFVRGGRLMAQPFDVEDLRKTGEPYEIGGPVMSTPAVGSTLQIAQFSVGRKTLAYFGNPNSAAAAAKLTPVAFSMGPPGITIVRNWAR